MILLILLTLVSFTQQCCFPYLYEGFEDIMLGSVGPGGSKATLTIQNIHFSYNATGKMVYAQGIEINHGEKVFIKTLQDYNKKVTYTIVNGQCTKSPLPTDFADPCAIDHIKPIREGYIGAGDEKKRIAVYEIKSNGIVESLSVDDNCIVIDQSFYGLAAQSMGSIRVSDVTLGIKDSSVFNVPSICQHEQSQHFSSKFVNEMHIHHTRSLQPISFMTRTGNF